MGLRDEKPQRGPAFATHTHSDVSQSEWSVPPKFGIEFRHSPLIGHSTARVGMARPLHARAWRRVPGNRWARERQGG
jgi:hypothetical protein